MQLLLQFLFKYRVFILFVIIEGICFSIIVSNNNYQGAKYLGASNRIAGSLISTRNSISDYFNLNHKNRLLAEENIRLRQRVLELSDSIVMADAVKDTISGTIKAKIIDNSLYFRNNYLMINRGSNDGVKIGMGVIGQQGIVGQVQQVSRHYATVISLLHSKTLISSKHLVSGSLCSVVWEGHDPLVANVKFLPRHINVVPGDTILTSGYNSVYPEGNMIGVISEVGIGPDETFYTVKLELSTNFSNLSFVYLLDLKDKEEIDSLRTKSMNIDG